jgi:hypothetical protein
MSVSEDSDEAAGGTMQIWRINDMIHRPQDEVVAELEQHRWAGGVGVARGGRGCQESRAGACTAVASGLVVVAASGGDQYYESHRAGLSLTVST